MNARVARVICFVNAHYRDSLTLGEVAKRFGAHPDYLSRRFKIEVGMTFHRYLVWKRIQYAKQLLINTSICVKQVGYDSGFGSPESFCKAFRREVGCSPRAYRNRGGLVTMKPRAGRVAEPLIRRMARV